MLELSRLTENQIHPQVLPSALDKKRVLIVDDTPDNAFLTSLFLKNTGCILEFASDGQAAVLKYMECQPDLVLMDLKMPGMDGFVATSWIRLLEKRSGRRAIVLALTAFSIKTEELRSLEAGCDGILMKPIRKSELIQSMSAYFSRSS